MPRKLDRETILKNVRELEEILSLPLKDVSKKNDQELYDYMEALEDELFYFNGDRW